MNPRFPASKADRNIQTSVLPDICAGRHTIPALSRWMWLEEAHVYIVAREGVKKIAQDAGLGLKRSELYTHRVARFALYPPPPPPLYLVIDRNSEYG